MSLSFFTSDLAEQPRLPGPERWLFPCVLPANWEAANPGDLRYLGDAETDALYREHTEWRRAMWQTDVLGIPVDMAGASDVNNRGVTQRMVWIAKEYHCKIWMECGGIYGVPGSLDTAAENVAFDLIKIEKIEAAGGTVDYLECDHPLRRAMGYNTGFSAQLGISLTAAAQMFADYIVLMHDERPDIKIGMVDQPANWSYDGKPMRNALQYLPPFSRSTPVEFADGWDELMDALTARSETLAFLNIDTGNEFPWFPADIHFADVDHWMTRMGKALALGKAAGVPSGFWITSAVGGGGGTGTLPGAAPGSDEIFGRRAGYFAEQCRREMPRFDQFIYGSFLYYPRDQAPPSTPWTFLDGFLQAIEIYGRY